MTEPCTVTVCISETSVLPVASLQVHSCLPDGIQTLSRLCPGPLSEYIRNAHSLSTPIYRAWGVYSCLGFLGGTTSASLAFPCMLGLSQLLSSVNTDQWRILHQQVPSWIFSLPPYTIDPVLEAALCSSPLEVQHWYNSSLSGRKARERSMAAWTLMEMSIPSFSPGEEDCRTVQRDVWKIPKPLHWWVSN